VHGYEVNNEARRDDAKASIEATRPTRTSIDSRVMVTHHY
jgi:hypothetical protein